MKPTVPFSTIIRTLLCVSLACAPSCGKDSTPAAAGGGAGGDEAPLDHPASPAEAAKFLDLTAFPLMPGAPEVGHLSVARLLCRATSDVKSAFEFQKKHLEALKWKETPGSAVTADYASGGFTRAGFYVSVMVSPTDVAGKVDVIIQNHGNANLAKLPLPAGAAPSHVGPMSAMYHADAPVPAAAEECRKLFIAAGWQPYGTSGDWVAYKQNGVLVTATVMASPVQSGKTMISYQSEQMSADIPAMPGAEGLRYTGSTGSLDFDVAATEEEVEQFYRKALAAGGWEATMDHIVKVENGKDFVVFRNPAKDMLTLNMNKELEGKTRVSLLHQSAAAVAEEDRRFKAFKEKRMKEAAEGKGKPMPAGASTEAENKPMSKVAVVLPAGAADVVHQGSQMKFTVGVGKAKATVETMQKQFVDAGWKILAPSLDGDYGNISFTKDGMRVGINYVDTGAPSARLEMSAVGAEFERPAGQ